MSATIIAAFPGTGKTYFAKHNKDLIISDSDSSKFSWLKPKIRNPKFPGNYIKHIQSLLDSHDIVLVSTHKEVLQALADAEIEYTLVAPNEKLRVEYVDRFFTRGNDPDFVTLLATKWYDFLRDINKAPGVHERINLYSGQFLGNIDWVNKIKE